MSVKTRKPLTTKELHKHEETRDPWAEAIAGLKACKRSVAGASPKTAIQQRAGSNQQTQNEQDQI